MPEIWLPEVTKNRPRKIAKFWHICHQKSNSTNPLSKISPTMFNDDLWWHFWSIETDPSETATPRKIDEKPKNFKHRKHENLQKPPYYERGIGATQKLVQIVDMNVGNNLYRIDFSISVSFGQNEHASITKSGNQYTCIYWPLNVLQPAYINISCCSQYG